MLQVYSSMQVLEVTMKTLLREKQQFPLDLRKQGPLAVISDPKGLICMPPPVISL